ncbi:Uncharacterised protein [Candidatus Gugararchaeum adminiculabundum]|nr:Uncharacterised protein [Candidatus Gugararchaeum adminiculabundum]
MAKLSFGISAFAIAITLLLLVSMVSAATGKSAEVDDATLQRIKEAAAQLGIKDVNGGAVQKVKEFYENMTPEELELWRTKSMIVIGSQLTGSEKASWGLLKEKFPELKDVQIVEDTPENYDKIINSDGPVVFVGGPSQNFATRLANEQGMITGTRATSFGFLNAQEGTTKSGQKILVISDSRGYDNLPREGAAKSPLNSFIPREYVPVAATGISVILMLIVQALFPFAQSIGEEKIIEKIGEKNVKLSKEAKSIFGIKIREVIAIFLGCAVIAIAVTYSFTGLVFPDFTNLFILNLVICLMVQVLRSTIQEIAEQHYKIDAEYVFWKQGSALTLVSSVLGNPFGLAGFMYVHEDEEEEANEKDEEAQKAAEARGEKPKTAEELKQERERKETRSEAIVGMLPSLACMFFAVLFAGINFFFPSEFLQMCFTILSFYTMLEILPIHPMPGKDVIKWNFFIWAFLFFPILFTYILINYLI